MPSWILHHGSRFPLHPSTATIRAGLLLLTLLAFLVTALSARSGKQSLWSYLLFGYISAMLMNVFVPHLPATVFFHGYTPGVVTAVLVCLPVMSILLFRAVRERWVLGGRAILFAMLVPPGIAGAILMLFTSG